jgi:hypothetical protein
LLRPQTQRRGASPSEAATAALGLQGGIRGSHGRRPGFTFSFNNIGHVLHGFEINGKKTRLIQPAKNAIARRIDIEQEERA